MFDIDWYSFGRDPFLHPEKETTTEEVEEKAAYPHREKLTDARTYYVPYDDD